MNSISEKNVIVLRKEVLCVDFKKVEVDMFEIETVSLFDDMLELYPDLNKFALTVYSPRKYYYNGLLNSGVLDVEDAWALYLKIAEQQLDNDFKQEIIELNKKYELFKSLYVKCINYYKNNNIL